MPSFSIVQYGGRERDTQASPCESARADEATPGSMEGMDRAQYCDRTPGSRVVRGSFGPIKGVRTT